MADSYSALEQGQGMDAAISGSPAASACISTSARRVLCMATRSKAELIVVISPAISYWPSCRSTCSAHALSFPLLHASRIFFFIGSYKPYHGDSEKAEILITERTE